MIQRGNDRDVKHAMDYVAERINDLYPDLTEDDFDVINNVVYDIIIDEPIHIGNRCAN